MRIIMLDDLYNLACQQQWHILVGCAMVALKNFWDWRYVEPLMNRAERSRTTESVKPTSFNQHQQHQQVKQSQRGVGVCY